MNQHRSLRAVVRLAFLLSAVGLAACGGGGTSDVSRTPDPVRVSSSPAAVAVVGDTAVPPATEPSPTVEPSPTEAPLPTIEPTPTIEPSPTPEPSPTAEPSPTPTPTPSGPAPVDAASGQWEQVAGRVNDVGTWVMNPSLAFDEDGAPVVAWVDYPSYQVYVKQLHGEEWVEMGAGSASGGGISNTSGMSWWPSIKAGPGGQMAVAWEEQSDDGSAVYVRQWQDGAWADTGPQPVRSGLSSQPEIAYDPDGRLVLIWTEKTADWRHSDVYALRWDGARWGEIGAGSASGRGFSQLKWANAPMGLAVGPSGDIVASWWGDRTGSVYAMRWQGDGWSRMPADNFGLVIENDVRGLSWARVAIGPDNETVAAWVDLGYVCARRWDGARWVDMPEGSSEIECVSGFGNAQSVELAITPDGAPILVWDSYINYDDYVDASIYARIWDGEAWRPLGANAVDHDAPEQWPGLEPRL
ncbi:MAG: hypothetical protein LC131_01625, partial [Anaerolineae bacterium]|nr:hypothetical protein [Anaerolineae bacterium]